MTRKRTNPDFLNGVPELLILRLLSEQAMHGYELVQNIRRTTNERLAFGEGCIYPLLHRLEKQGLLDSTRIHVNGRSRVVYDVTPKGKSKLVETAANWRAIVAAVSEVLQGGSHEEPVLA